jgi:hypothetical protein
MVEDRRGALDEIDREDRANSASGRSDAAADRRDAEQERQAEEARRLGAIGTSTEAVKGTNRTRIREQEEKYQEELAKHKPKYVKMAKSVLVSLGFGPLGLAVSGARIIGSTIQRANAARQQIVDNMIADGVDPAEAESVADAAIRGNPDTRAATETGRSAETEQRHGEAQDRAQMSGLPGIAQQTQPVQPVQPQPAQPMPGQPYAPGQDQGYNPQGAIQQYGQQELRGFGGMGPEEAPIAGRGYWNNQGGAGFWNVARQNTYTNYGV